MQKVTDEKEQPTCIEDLTLREAEATHIKGGPASADYILPIDGIKGESDLHQKR